MKFAARLKPSFRNTYWIGFLLCLSLLVIAVFLQNNQHLNPCPLCIIQRLAIALLGLWFFIAALHIPRDKWRRYHSGLICITSILGLIAASRQVWLEHLPAGTAPACGPGLDYMLQYFPWHQTIYMIFQGSGDCAEVTWRFLGLSIPSWTLFFFVLFFVVGLWQGMRKVKQ